MRKDTRAGWGELKDKKPGSLPGCESKFLRAFELISSLQLQVSIAVAETFPPVEAGTVAVTVTAPPVAALQVATPKVGPTTLLMVTFTGSETDQVAVLKLPVRGLHPAGGTSKALNCCALAGGAAAWSAVAVLGVTVICTMSPHFGVVFPPQPANPKANANRAAQDKIFMACAPHPCILNGGTPLFCMKLRQ
jgi:hypothetical protein